MRHGVFGILAAISFLISLIIWLFDVKTSHALSYVTFMLLGLLLLTVHETVYWYRGGRGVAA
jgi:hypothetical protein